jgi:hypothetical protein
MGHLTDGDFSTYLEQDEAGLDNEMRNAFAFWLHEKTRFHIRRGDCGPPPFDPLIGKAMGEVS